MKCPKCGYLGFEAVDRCRNCGYEFSLAQPITVLDLSIRQPDEPVRSIDPPVELPLFGPPIPDDEPLITKASPPRPPLAVRRSTPASPPRPQPLDLLVDADEPPPVAPPPIEPARAAEPPVAMAQESEEPDAPAVARLVAVAIDLLILAVVDAIVVYFTMQICGISLADLAVLPKGPLIAFLLVQNGGYFVAFTAGGQTLGKMAVGIKVVPADRTATLDVGRACTREVMWLLMAAPAGLGFLTIFMPGHRGLHDRLAGTRVVR